MEKVISIYGEDAIRHKPIEIAGYYLGLLYLGKDGSYKLFQDIDDLPEGWDRKLVKPVSLTELLYIAVYEKSEQIPNLVTRYPITGLGSIYPSWTLLMPTVNTEVRHELGDDWQPDPTKKVAHYFPVADSPHVNSFSPHQTKLKGLGMD